jgi:hypothetical protein
MLKQFFNSLVSRVVALIAGEGIGHGIFARMIIAELFSA